MDVTLYVRIEGKVVGYVRSANGHWFAAYKFRQPMRDTASGLWPLADCIGQFEGLYNTLEEVFGVRGWYDPSQRGG